MTRDIVVIGAGIVGLCVAGALARKGIRALVLERDEGPPRGSTAFAPGFVGLYNDVPILTELARASAAIYATAEAGFARSGGLELATSDAGVADIVRRAHAAQSVGLASRLLKPSELPEAVVDSVDVGQILAGA